MTTLEYVGLGLLALALVGLILLVGPGGLAAALGAVMLIGATRAVRR